MRSAPSREGTGSSPFPRRRCNPLHSERRGAEPCRRRAALPGHVDRPRSGPRTAAPVARERKARPTADRRAPDTAGDRRARGSRRAPSVPFRADNSGQVQPPETMATPLPRRKVQVRALQMTREPLIPKLRARVRFSSPAPRKSPRPAARGFFVVWTVLSALHHLRTARPPLTGRVHHPPQPRPRPPSAGPVGVPIDQGCLLLRLVGAHHRVLSVAPDQAGTVGPICRRSHKREFSGRPTTVRALRRYRPKVDRGNGFAVSPTGSRPSAPFSTYRLMCCRSPSTGRPPARPAPTGRRSHHPPARGRLRPHVVCD